MTVDAIPGGTGLRPGGRPRPPRWLLRVVLITAGILVAGNLAITGAFLAARASDNAQAPEDLGINHLRRVDDKVWRGEAPSEEGYRLLAAHDVTTVVDLRAERELEVPVQLLDELGIKHVAIPVRDGQPPTRGDVERFLDVVAASDGKVFVHCAAGVGRTGSMVGAYLVTQGKASPLQALRHALSIGPPSLEQIAFILGLDPGEIDRPPFAATALSRLFDAPRRTWSRMRALEARERIERS